MERDRYFTAQESVAYGLVDRVIDKRELPGAREGLLGRGRVGGAAGAGRSGRPRELAQRRPRAPVRSDHLAYRRRADQTPVSDVSAMALTSLHVAVSDIR